MPIFILFPLFAAVIFLIAQKRARRLVSRESAKSIFRENKFSAVFTAIVSIVALLILQFGALPAFDFSKFNIETPFLLELAPYAISISILILILLSLYTLFSKSIDREFDEKMQRNKEADMIKVSELSTKRLNWVLVLILALTAVVIAFFVLLPAYILLGSIKQEYEHKTLSGEYTVPGMVVKIDTSRMAIDGDGIVILQTDWGELVVTVPAEGKTVCSAGISDFWNLKIGDRVEVAGSFMNGKATICESPRHFLKRVTAVDASDSTPSDTDGWQTYRNSEFGFEVRYPSEIYKTTPLDSKDTYPELNYERHIPDFREGIRLSSLKPEFYCSNFELLVYEKGERTLNQWMQEYPEFERGFEEKEAGVFGGKSSISFSYPRGDIVPGVSLVEGNSFILQINVWGGLSGISTLPECGDILSTLRFINNEKRDITVSETWKYFNFPKDYKHHLEIPYPSNWFVGCCNDADSFSIHLVYPFEYKDVPIEDQPYMHVIDFRSWECPDGSFYCSIDETRVISPHQFFDKMKVEIGKTGEFLKIGGLSNLVRNGSEDLSSLGTVDVYEGLQSGTVSVKVYLFETTEGVSAIVFRKPDEFGESLMEEFLRRFKINSKN